MSRHNALSWLSFWVADAGFIAGGLTENWWLIGICLAYMLIWTAAQDWWREDDERVVR